MIYQKGMMEWFDSYTFEVTQSIEFLIALSSMVGLLGLIIGLIFFNWGNKSNECLDA
jgi:hypothetical protein